MTFRILAWMTCTKRTHRCFPIVVTVIATLVRVFRVDRVLRFLSFVFATVIQLCTLRPHVSNQSSWREGIGDPFLWFIILNMFPLQCSSILLQKRAYNEFLR